LQEEQRRGEPDSLKKLACKMPNMHTKPEITLIYLDICCFNRPFDDQSQLLVRLQTEAKLDIQQSIREGKLALAWSAVLDLENSANTNTERSKIIDGWKSFAVIDIDLTPQIEAMAEEIADSGVKPMDALHVANAIAAGAAYLLTTDKQLLKKMTADPRIHVIDPIDFIRSQYSHEN
jgi:predicted nucleic acid-binding protein